jgi:hypothetical protein
MIPTVFFVISISFLVISTLAAMTPLSDIMKKCFANRQLNQINYILTQTDDDTFYNMVETFKGNQHQFVGTSKW